MQKFAFGLVDFAFLAAQKKHSFSERNKSVNPGGFGFLGASH